MPRNLDQPLARGGLEEILHRAIAIDSGAESTTATVNDAYQIAAELGLSIESVDQAVARQNPSLPGIAGCASASIIASGDSNAYTLRLESSLRSHLLDRGPATEPGWWEQRRGWWPDISRNLTVLHVHSSTEVFDERFRATLAVPLIWIRLVHGGVALLGLAAMIGMAVIGLISVALWMLGVALAAGATYYLRMWRIGLCLDEALREAAEASGKAVTLESAGWTLPTPRIRKRPQW